LVTTPGGASPAATKGVIFAQGFFARELDNFLRLGKLGRSRLRPYMTALMVRCRVAVAVDGKMRHRDLHVL